MITDKDMIIKSLAATVLHYILKYKVVFNFNEYKEFPREYNTTVREYSSNNILTMSLPSAL